MAVDPENCNYVLIENCFFNTGDDCIAVKAGRNRDGRELGEAGHPTQNLIIRNNTFADGHGGIACGSEMSGGVKNVTVTQCLMDHTDRGLRVKTRRGRGKYAVIDGLVFRDVVMDGVLTPFVINMFYFATRTAAATMYRPTTRCRWMR